MKIRKRFKLKIKRQIKFNFTRIKIFSEKGYFDYLSRNPVLDWRNIVVRLKKLKWGKQTKYVTLKENKLGDITNEKMA